MKRIALAPAIAVLATALPAAAEMQSYTIDPLHTKPTYDVMHLGYSIQRGRFDKTSGKIMLDTAAKKGSADVTIDAASVDSGVPKLDEHLKGADFFNVAQHPTITFKSSSFAFDGDNVKSVTGELTMNGVTQPVTLTANLFKCAPHPVTKKAQCGGDFQTTVKRSEFGIKYGIPLVADDVTLHIPVESVKD
ncbi:MAG: YceI family protein [Usitatibacter sp.]